MKKIIIISMLIMMSCALFAQEKVDSVKFTYCELVGMGKFMSNKVTVSIDFGQEKKFLSDNRYKDAVTGKPVVFNSMVDALNFMGKTGWEFVQAYTVGDSQSGYVYHWLLKRLNL
jgi:hypothetical protein